MTKRRERAKELNQSKKLHWIALMGGKCQDCGGVFPPYAYDFHHVDGTKEANPSAALKWAPERAKVELEKCVLLCSNCHRGRHFGEQGVTNDQVQNQEAPTPVV